MGARAWTSVRLAPSPNPLGLSELTRGFTTLQGTQNMGLLGGCIGLQCSVPQPYPQPPPKSQPIDMFESILPNLILGTISDLQKWQFYLVQPNNLWCITSMTQYLQWDMRQIPITKYTNFSTGETMTIHTKQEKQCQFSSHLAAK